MALARTAERDAAARARGAGLAPWRARYCHGRCYDLAPEVFAEDERGHCRVLKETVPRELERQARLGEASYPEDAISTEES